MNQEVVTLEAGLQVQLGIHLLIILIMSAQRPLKGWILIFYVML